MTPRRIVVGLGNPGPDYVDTRHNLGFRVVEALAARRGAVPAGEVCAARLALMGDALLAQPQTFMNRSGYSVRCLAERLSVATEAVLVVYDDVALPLGRLRARARGGAGGHRGMESVLESLRSEEVPRLRLGIAPEGGPAASADLAAWVLAPFDPDERPLAGALVEQAADAVDLWLDAGIAAVMNRFNAGELPPDGSLR